MNAVQEQGWVVRWRGLLRSEADATAGFGRGRAFQRTGQVVALRLEPGRLSGRVQGARPTPYQVEALLGVLGDRQWSTIVRVVAGQVRFAAGLLAGQVTDGLVEALDDAGVDLFGSNGDVDARCPCGEASRPCAHVVALWEEAAVRFSDDPFALFLLRGRGRRRLLADLHALRRGGGEEPRTVALADMPREGWAQARESLEEIRLPHGASADPLRLLGDPPGWTGAASAEALLGPLVERAARRARAESGGEAVDGLS